MTVGDALFGSVAIIAMAAVLITTLLVKRTNVIVTHRSVGDPMWKSSISADDSKGG